MTTGHGEVGGRPSATCSGWGIGDTIRVSLSADPVDEVRVGFDILKALGLSHRGVNIISCPSCARQGFDVIRTVETLEKRLEHIKTPMSLSIIGCVVNGPGEALMTDLGFTGGGAGSGMVYMAGKQHHKLGNAGMVEHIVELVEKRAAELEAERAAAPRRRSRSVGRLRTCAPAVMITDKRVRVNLIAISLTPVNFSRFSLALTEERAVVVATIAMRRGGD